MSEPLLTPQQVGDQFGMTVGALAQQRYLGTGPRFVKLSPKAVRYRQSDLDQWLEQSIRTQSAQDDHRQRPRTDQPERLTAAAPVSSGSPRARMVGSKRRD